MISLTINSVPTLFIKAFTSADVQNIVNFVRKAAGDFTGTGNTVLFIDTPITTATVEAVDKLKAEGFRVVFRDHHGITGEPANERDKQVAGATARLMHLLGEDCCITVRDLHPACSTLVSVGEFADAVAIIADPDADGLTAAMKAAGISYPELDDDAAKLDGEPQYQVTGTPISQLLAKGFAVLPSFDPSKVREREKAQQNLFTDWLKTVCGNEAATKRLEERVALYEEAVKVSQALAQTAIDVAQGVLLVDVADKPLYDPGTLEGLLEKAPGCRIIVLRKSLGPIAALHGIQYSLSVPKRYQDAIDLHILIPPNARSAPETGIISNVSFLLHTSEDVWNNHVLGRLKSLNLAF